MVRSSPLSPGLTSVNLNTSLWFPWWQVSSGFSMLPSLHTIFFTSHSQILLDNHFTLFFSLQTQNTLHFTCAQLKNSEENLQIVISTSIRCQHPHSSNQPSVHQMASSTWWPDPRPKLAHWRWHSSTVCWVHSDCFQPTWQILERSFHSWYPEGF